MSKWEYATVEFESPGSQRSASLQELFKARGAEGWRLVYMGDPERYTASRVVHERRLLVFMRQASPESDWLLENADWGT